MRNARSMQPSYCILFAPHFNQEPVSEVLFHKMYVAVDPDAKYIHKSVHFQILSHKKTGNHLKLSIRLFVVKGSHLHTTSAYTLTFHL